MNTTATLNLIISLNRGVLDGKLRRRDEVALKGGKGMCIIYTDKCKHSDPRVYEAGKILMREGATIGEHAHENDWEEYTVLAGMVTCEREVYFPGDTMVCRTGKSHSVENIAEGESVLRFVKRK